MISTKYPPQQNKLEMNDCKNYKVFKAGLLPRRLKLKYSVKFPLGFRITPSISNARYMNVLNQQI